MPNNFNYSADNVISVQSRPDRLSSFELKVSAIGNKPADFGLSKRDVVEVNLYDEDNFLAYRGTFYASDEVLTASTVIDQQETKQFLNLDMPEILQRMNALPGRYSISINFFRDEVGSDAGEKLYIEKISPSRTELRVRSISQSKDIQNQIFEFTVPSVSKLHAQGLINEVFNKSLDARPGESVTSEKVLELLGEEIRSKVNYIGGEQSLKSFIDAAISNINDKVLDTMFEKKEDSAIQEVELREFISGSIESVLRDMVNTEQLDPRFELV